MILSLLITEYFSRYWYFTPLPKICQYPKLNNIFQKDIFGRIVKGVRLGVLGDMHRK